MSQEEKPSSSGQVIAVMQPRSHFASLCAGCHGMIADPRTLSGMATLAKFIQRADAGIQRETRAGLRHRASLVRQKSGKTSAQKKSSKDSGLRPGGKLQNVNPSNLDNLPCWIAGCRARQSRKKLKVWQTHVFTQVFRFSYFDSSGPAEFLQKPELAGRRP